MKKNTLFSDKNLLIISDTGRTRTKKNAHASYWDVVWTGHIKRLHERQFKVYKNGLFTK